MRGRVILYGTLALLAIVAVALWWSEEVRFYRGLRLRSRLWNRDGEQLVHAALRARGMVGDESVPERSRPFVSWDRWPPHLQKHGLLAALKVVSTDRVDNIIVTSFVKSGNLEARWFYVVPVSLGSERPWFRVVAMTPEYLLYNAFPDGLDPIIEKQKERPVDPIKVIKRLCSERGRPGAGSGPIP